MERMLRRSTLGCALALVLAGARGVSAQDKPADAATAKLAEIQSFEGKIQIKGANGTERAPTLVAKRIRGGSLFNGDAVATEAGGTAKILFLDSTQVTVEEKSRVQVEEKKLARPSEKGQTIGRTIRILAGRVASAVEPSKSIVTEFETPAGVAAVRGTTLEVAFDGKDLMTLIQREGTTHFADADDLGDALVKSGTSLTIRNDGPRGSHPVWEVHSGKTTVMYEVPGVGRVECDMDSGDRIELDPDIGARVEAGTVEVRTPDGDEVTLSQGKGTGPDDDLSVVELFERAGGRGPATGAYSGPGSSFDTGTYHNAMGHTLGETDGCETGGGGCIEDPGGNGW